MSSSAGENSQARGVDLYPSNVFAGSFSFFRIDLTVFTSRSTSPFACVNFGLVLLSPINRVKPAINFIRVQHETWPTPKRRMGLVASVYICQGDRWLTIRDNGNITGHWRDHFSPSLGSLCSR